MSVLLMSAAFKTALPATTKLVLLGLCDCANDAGECYPSVSNLMEKCSAGERTVQVALKALQEMGFVSRDFRTGRSTLYCIKQPSQWPQTPAAGAPQQQVHPRSTCTHPPQHVHPTPAVHAPTPAVHAPRTIKETSKNRQGNQKTAPTVVGVAELVEAGFTDRQAEDFIAHKRSVKAPLTARAWADHKAEAVKAGWSAVDAAEKVMARGWKGFESRYVAGERPGKPASKQTALEAHNAAVAAKLWESVR